ncbi:MAG: TlpA family protein disulfide reductase [Thermoflavifilum aggregans]|nr:TlpA family protein disulfide reductase [Thermoflavifilum aggregans]
MQGLKTIGYALVWMGLASCAWLQSEKPMQLQPGSYRAYIQRPDGIQIPFQMQIVDSNGKTVVYMLNGAERIRIDSIVQHHQHFTLHMPLFNSDFTGLALNDGTLQGQWIRHLPDSDQHFFFRAIPDTHRFDVHHAPRFNISGTWATYMMRQGRSDTAFAVGLFHQEGDRLYGTFMHSDGDDRYLAGVVDGDTLKLSTFNGGDLYLYIAHIANDHTIRDGQFYSGYAGYARWWADKDSTAHLPDALTLTTVIPGKEQLDFRFPDLYGDTVALHDYRGKVVLVEIMGSWCPNCMDETAFLSSLYEQYHAKGLQIIALAYERSADYQQARQAVMSFQQRFHVTYPMLITGVTYNDPQMIAKTLPNIQHFQAFPTTLFIDKSGHIRYIHTGFAGPGTGVYYSRTIAEFKSLIDTLLQE